MARRRRVGIRGGDGPGWRGEAEAARGTGWTSGRTAESAALLRPLRSPSPPPDPEGRGGCGARVLPWTRISQGSTGGNRTALSHAGRSCAGARAGGCAGARARPRMRARAGRLRALLAKARLRGRADRCQAGGRAGGRVGRWATPCDCCGRHARQRARRCTAYSAELPGPPPAPAGAR